MVKTETERRTALKMGVVAETLYHPNIRSLVVATFKEEKTLLHQGLIGSQSLDFLLIPAFGDHSSWMNGLT